MKKFDKTRSAFWLAVSSSFIFLSSCAPSGVNNAGSYRGSVALDNVKLEIPENMVSESFVTFVLDPSVNLGGKTQYVSRTNDNQGGQYCVVFKGGKCYLLRVLYRAKPVTKEYALQLMSDKIQGTDKPVLVKPLAVAKGRKNPVELYELGSNYRGELEFADPKGQQVAVMSVWEPAVQQETVN